MVRHPKECRACGRKRCGFSLRECNPKRSAHGIFRFTDIGSDDTRSGGYFSAMRFTSFVGGGLIVCGGLERGRSLDGHHADEEEQQSGETQQRGTDPRCVCVCVCVCVRERERDAHGERPSRDPFFLPRSGVCTRGFGTSCFAFVVVWFRGIASHRIAHNSKWFSSSESAAAAIASRTSPRVGSLVESVMGPSESLYTKIPSVLSK